RRESSPSSASPAPAAHHASRPRFRRTVPRSHGGLRELELARRGPHPILGASSSVIGRPAPAPRPWKFQAQYLRQNLEEPRGVRKARQAMSTETAESDA